MVGARNLLAGILGLAKEAFGRLGLIRSRSVSKVAAFVMGVILKLNMRLPEYVDTAEGRLYLLQGDRVSFWLALTGSWEPVETDLVKRTVKRGEVAVDIGAHIGHYSIVLSRLVGPEGKVYAFEPCKENYDLLSRNMKANGCTNVVIEQKAVSSKSDVIKMRGWAVESDLSPASEGAEGARYDVEAIRLDDYMKQGRIDFVKIDIEGHEYEALKGAEALLGRSKSAKMISEFYPRLLRENGIAPEEYLKFLVDHGFRLFEITQDADVLKPIPDTAGFAKSLEGPDAIADLFCIKEPEGDRSAPSRHP